MRSAPQSRLFAAISLIKRIASGEILGFLERMAFACHARPDCGANGRRSRERGYDPTLRGICVLEPYAFSRGRAALLQVGFVLFGRAITLDRRIIRSATRARTEQHGRNDQRAAERSHVP